MTNFFDLLVSYVENVLRWQSFQFFSKICCREKKHPREFVFVEKKSPKHFFTAIGSLEGMDIPCGSAYHDDNHILISTTWQYPDVYLLLTLVEESSSTTLRYHSKNNFIIQKILGEILWIVALVHACHF